MVAHKELVEYITLFIDILMAESKMYSSDEEKDYMQEHMRNWRSWGSWFSWGSPVGLGIWFVLTSASFWIVMHALR